MAHINQQIYEALTAEAKTQFPGFEVRAKEDSLLMKILAKLLFFNKRFMSDYTTTVGYKIYAPKDTREFPLFWKVVAHEYVHMHDRKHAPARWLTYGLWYMAPQIFAVLGLVGAVVALATWNPVWLWSLLALLLAAPIPSPGRTHYEMRGYTMSMAVNYWRYGSVRDYQREHVLEKFTGPDYYWMWPFKGSMKKKIDNAVAMLESGRIFQRKGAQPFIEVHGLLRDLGVLKESPNA